MSKLVAVAGVSKCNGVTKVRFASDMVRTKTLVKTGHSDIDLIEFPSAMTKEDAVAYLLSIGFDNGLVCPAIIQKDLPGRNGDQTGIGNVIHCFTICDPGTCRMGLAGGIQDYRAELV